MNLEIVRHILLTKFINKKFLSFLFVGVINTLITYGIYYFLLRWINYNIAYSISYISGIVISYYLNSVVVFKKKINIKTFLKFPIVYVAQYICNLLFMNLFIIYLYIPEKIAPILVIILTVPITFFLSKIVFGDKRK